MLVKGTNFQLQDEFVLGKLMDSKIIIFNTIL